MRVWHVAAAVAALGIVGATIPFAAADEPQEKKAEQDKGRAERELKELHAQREKIDSRIRELSKQLGREEDEVRVFKFKPGDGEFKGLTKEHHAQIEKAIRSAHESIEKSGLTKEHHAEIERAIKEAHAAIEKSGLSKERHAEIEKAMKLAHEAIGKSIKNMPDLKVIGPDKFLDKEDFKVFVEKDGKSLHFDKLSPEQRDKIKRDMSELREKMKGRGEELRLRAEELRKSAPGDRVLRIQPREGDSDLRREMEFLREELRQLREELRRELRNRGSNPTSDSFEVL